MTEEARLPAKLEIGALIRVVGNAGGFASVLHSGEPEAGTAVPDAHIVTTPVAEKLPA